MKAWLRFLVAVFLGGYQVRASGECMLKQVPPEGENDFSSLDPHWEKMKASFTRRCQSKQFKDECESYGRVNHGLDDLKETKPCLWYEYECSTRGYIKQERNKGGTGRDHTTLYNCQKETTDWNETYFCCAEDASASACDTSVGEKPAFTARDRQAYEHREYVCREVNDVVVSKKRYSQIWCCKNPHGRIGEITFTDEPSRMPTEEPTAQPVRTATSLPACKDDASFAVRIWTPYTKCESYKNKDPFVGDHQYCPVDVGYGDDGVELPAVEACPEACETCHALITWVPIPGDKGGKECPHDNILEEVHSETEDQAKNNCLKWHTPKEAGACTKDGDDVTPVPIGGWTQAECDKIDGAELGPGAGKCEFYSWQRSGALQGFTQICSIDLTDAVGTNPGWVSGKPSPQSGIPVAVVYEADDDGKMVIKTEEPEPEPTSKPTREPTRKPTNKPVEEVDPITSSCPADAKKEKLCVCEGDDCKWGAVCLDTDSVAVPNWDKKQASCEDADGKFNPGKTCAWAEGANPQCTETPPDECNANMKMRDCKKASVGDVVCAWDAEIQYCEQLMHACNAYKDAKTCKNAWKKLEGRASCSWAKSKCVEGPILTCDSFKKSKDCENNGCVYAKKAADRPKNAKGDVAPACYDPAEWTQQKG